MIGADIANGMLYLTMDERCDFLEALREDGFRV